MRLVIDRGQALEVQVGVDLGCRDLGVPQEFLHGPQIPTALQQMAGKRVSKHVRVDLEAKTGGLGLFGELTLNRPTRQTLTALIDEESRLVRLGWLPSQNTGSLG